jgi:hypothetical protein
VPAVPDYSAVHSQDYRTAPSYTLLVLNHVRTSALPVDFAGLHTNLLVTVVYVFHGLIRQFS